MKSLQQLFFRLLNSILFLSGMLQHADGSVLKPIQPPPRGEREVAFYKKLFEPSCDDPVLMTLRPFLPKLLGIWTPQVPAVECSKSNTMRT